MAIVEEIAERHYNEDQSWWYEFIAKFQVGRDTYKLRTHIKRNAYDNQSFVRGYVFSLATLEWKLLVDRPINGAECQQVSYVSNTAIEPFRRDSASVFKELGDILL